MTLPDGWKQGRLGKLCSIEIGGTPSRGVAAYWDSAHDTSNVWVSIRDMRQRLITASAEQISDLGVKKSNVKLLQPDTVLLSFKLSIGRVAIAAVPLFTNEAIAGLSPNGLTRDFLFQGLQGWDLLQGVDQAIKGATLNKRKLKKILFEYPESEREQAKIAEVLSTVDRAIQQTEALIAKQQRIKTGLMQDLLTRGIDEHGNLRSEQTHEFKDSPLGRIPVEWSAVKLDRLASRVGSGVTPTGGESVYTPEGVLFIRSQNVHFNGLRLNDVAYIPERIHLSMLRSEVFENDVLLNITGASIGRCCRMPEIDGRANVNQHVCAIRLFGSSEATAGVLAAVLESHIGQHQITQLNAGGNREGLNYQQVRSLALPWPGDDSEFARIYSGIRQIADRLAASQFSLDKLRRLKTGLMQDLLTGDRRVTALLRQGDRATS
ncbi:MAG: restriction endonuclease subunit S [Gemmatimonadota bacterium]|nr:restriction endonuclease subunit S [Gemmatimonadota bacterium]